MKSFTQAALAGASAFLISICSANAEDLPGRPDVVIKALVDRIYVMGETSGGVEDMMAAEAKAADDIRQYIASGATAGLLEEEKGQQSPLMTAAYMGYPNVVSALLTSRLVKAHINDADEMGLTPWIAAVFSMKQTLWTCNPAVLDNPFKFIPMFVTQPFYTSNPVPPYKKARELLEAAGATHDMAQAKTVWLTACENQSAATKAKVKASTDLQKTVQDIGAADLNTQVTKLMQKAGMVK